MAAELIRRRRVRVSLVFKSFQAEFLRRPEADVFFTCAEGPRIRDLLDRVLASGERCSELIPLTAAVRMAVISPACRMATGSPIAGSNRATNPWCDCRPLAKFPG